MNKYLILVLIIHRIINKFDQFCVGKTGGFMMIDN